MGEREFGHVVWSGRGILADAWGVGPFIINVGEKAYRFEDSERFGPYLVAKDGRVLERQPGERSDFWRPHWLWREQGRRLKADGVTCIYTLPRPPFAYLKGAQIIMISQGEKDMEESIVIFDPHKKLTGEPGQFRRLSPNAHISIARSTPSPAGVRAER